MMKAKDTPISITDIMRDDVGATCTPSADRGLDKESSGGEQPTKLE